MLIGRYLRREILYTFVGVVGVIFLIALSNKFVRLIAKAASGEFSPEVLFQVMLFQVPELLAFLLPIGLFLAILLCYSRFFTDNEIPVMLACGIPWSRLLKSALIMALGVMIVVAALTCYCLPQLAQYRDRLMGEEGPMLLVQTVTPGRFHALRQEGLVFYVAESSHDKRALKRIFIADEPGAKQDEKNHSVLTAWEGKVVTDPQNGATYLTLLKGQRYAGHPGEQDYSILQFERYQRLIEGKARQEGVYFHRTMPTKMLWSSPNASDQAELQWRLSLPLSVPLLALLALPLSRVSPRAGRFSNVLIAIIACILYFNLLTMSKRWVAADHLSPLIGVWWVHGLLLIVGGGFFIHVSGRWGAWKYASKQWWAR